MKRILLVLILSILIPSALFAGGGHETTDQTATGETVTSSAGGASSAESQEALTEIYGGSESVAWMFAIADVFDEVTELFCMSLTPYPGMLALFYNDEGGEMNEMTLNDVLLINDGYYEIDPILNSFVAEDATIDRSDNNTQKRSWNMVTLLFVSFLLAEIVFSAIYGYLTDKDGGVLKDIVSKVVVCLCLFLLASALPFLVEAFRAGFYQMALVITGLENEIRSPDNINGESKLSLLMKTIRDASVFQYPGILIRTLTSTIDMLSPGNITGSEQSIWEKTDTGFIGRILISLLYIIIRVIAYIIVVFSALHIMMNVCEVYLLLGIATCLMPFSVFSPTRWIGQNVVRSLISNTIELFVLLVIIFSSFTSANVIFGALTSILQSSITGVSVEIRFANTGAFQAVTGEEYPIEYSEGSGVDGTEVNPMYTDPETGETYLRPLYINFGTTGDEGYNGHLDMSLDMDSFYTNDHTAVNEAGDIVIENIENFFDMYKTGAPAGQTDFLYNMRRNYANMHPSMTIDEINQLLAKVTFKDLPAGDKLNVLEAWEELHTGAVEVFVNDDYEWGANPYETNNFFTVHIVSVLLVIFLQTYFINQSSQITNALLSGGVANESLSAAAYRLAFPMITRAVTFPVRAVGAMAKSRFKKTTSGGGGGGSRGGDGWGPRTLGR